MFLVFNFLLKISNSVKYLLLLLILEEIHYMDDSQRTQFYNFEHELYKKIKNHLKLIRLSECQIFVNEIYAKYGIVPPKVKDGRGKKVARGGLLRIELPKAYRELMDIIHECCHGIKLFYDPDGEDHGETFSRLCIDNYSQYMNLDLEFLEKSCKSLGIKLASKNSCKPPKLKEVREVSKEIKKIKNKNEDIKKLEKSLLSLKRDFVISNEILKNKFEKIQNAIWNRRKDYVGMDQDLSAST